MAFFDAMVAELFLGPNYYDFPTGLYYTQILSRVLISAELVLGAAILVDKWVKKITIPSIILMLLLFTVHLFYEGLTSDKGFVEGNCGCFGDVLPMNNLESIIKNIVAMLVGVFVWFKYNKDQRIAAWVAPVVLGAVTLATLMFGVKRYQEGYDIEVQQPEIVSQWVDSMPAIDSIPIAKDTSLQIEVTKDDAQTKAPDDKVDQQQTKSTGVIALLQKLGIASEGQEMDLTTGDVAVCLFSMTCGHCQESYKEMCELSAFATLPKLYLVNYGKEFEQKYFFNQAGNCNHPFIRTEDYTKFNRLLEGKGFPRILALKNGKIVQDWNIDSYSKQVFMDHFGIEETNQNADDSGLNLKKKDETLEGLEKMPWE